MSETTGLLLPCPLCRRGCVRCGWTGTVHVSDQQQYRELEDAASREQESELEMDRRLAGE